MKISPFQALTMLAKKYKGAEEGSNEAKLFAQVKQLFLMGVQNEEDLGKLKDLLNDDALKGYEIPLLEQSDFELLKHKYDDIPEEDKPKYLEAINKLEIINNDPVRRYFESTLCHDTLRDNIDSLDKDLLQQHFDLVFSSMPMSMRILVPLTIYHGNVDGAAAKNSSTAPEYITAIQKLRNPNNFPSFKPEKSKGTQSPDQVLKERVDKMMLLLKTVHAGMTSVNNHKQDYFPLNIYGESGSVYSPARRGRTDRVDGVGGKQEVFSNNLGIMRSYMPLSRDDTLFEDPSMDTSNQYRRPADASTYVSSGDMPQKFFSTQVSPFVNSISGTMLTQLRVMAKLLNENKLLYEDNPEQLKVFFKCFVSYMIYNSGGHSLQEFTSVFELPQVQAIFKDVPGFSDLNLRQLFQEENDKSFMSAMDQAIDYNDSILMRNAMHSELTSTTEESEKRAVKISEVEAKIKANWEIYNSSTAGENEKFAAKKYLFSKEAREYYKEHFCNKKGEIKLPLTYDSNGSVKAYKSIKFDKLKENELESTIFEKLRSAEFIHHDELTARVRGKLKPQFEKESIIPIQERVDRAMDCLMTQTDDGIKQDQAALLIVKQINAMKRRMKEDPPNFLSEDGETLKKVKSVFSKLEEGESPISGAPKSDRKMIKSVLKYYNSVYEEKKAKLYKGTLDAPSLASRLDKAYEIYKDENAHLMDKELAQEFIIYALDIKNPEYNLNEQIIKAMNLREVIKEKNPDFIPGRSPLPLDVLDPELLAGISKTSKFKKTDNPTIRSIFEEGDLLDVITQAKQKDQGGKHGTGKKTVFYEPLERDTFRVDISNGLFQQFGKPLSTSKSLSHGKKGFAAFTLDVNGELSVFPHIDHDKTGVAHSSMNKGKPVVCAGEIKIENGKLLAITTYSGHYRPTLYNIHKLLEYFERRGVDISETKVFSFKDPQVLGISSKPSKEYSRFYESHAQDLMQTYKSAIRKDLHSIKEDLLQYKSSREGIWHRIFHNSDLTQEKLNIVKNLLEYLDVQERALNKTDNLNDYEKLLTQLSSVLKEMNKENINVSKQYERSEGKLSEKLSLFMDKVKENKKQLQEIKKENSDMKDSSDDERVNQLKTLGRPQS